MFNGIADLISWDSIWNPYTFPDAKRIVALIILAMAGSVCLTAVIYGRKNAAAVLKRELLFFWLFTIVSATLLARKEAAEPKINLDLFWTVKYALKHRSGIHWFYAIGNIALFIPLGLLLPVSGSFFRSCIWTVLTGLLLSMAIEGSQYIWKLGLCELDDVLHNTWGTLFGYCIYRLAAPGVRLQPLGRKMAVIACKCGCAVVLSGTVALFWVLLRMNPPL